MVNVLAKETKTREVASQDPNERGWEVVSEETCPACYMKYSRDCAQCEKRANNQREIEYIYRIATLEAKLAIAKEALESAKKRAEKIDKLTDLNDAPDDLPDMYVSLRLMGIATHSDILLMEIREALQKIKDGAG